MAHLGASEVPILLAIVTGAVAIAFAIVDYTRFGRSWYGVAFLAIAVVMGMFTVYHLELVLVHQVRTTTEAFGAVVETIIALVSVVIILGYRRGDSTAGERS
ncbi:MAG: hypothetical protein ABEJ77_03680 [Halanaeroarchaeum sp.]